jgi:hypothetical protein
VHCYTNALVDRRVDQVERGVEHLVEQLSSVLPGTVAPLSRLAGLPSWPRSSIAPQPRTDPRRRYNLELGTLYTGCDQSPLAAGEVNTGTLPQFGTLNSQR